MSGDERQLLDVGDRVRMRYGAATIANVVDVRPPAVYGVVADIGGYWLTNAATCLSIDVAGPLDDWRRIAFGSAHFSAS